MSDLLLLPIRPLLHRAITALEAIYEPTAEPWSAEWEGETIVFGRAAELPEELFMLRNSPDWETQQALARQVWKAAVTGNETTVWFIRNFSPEASILFLLCAVSDVPFGKILERTLSEAQFLRLTSAIARITNRPLFVSESPEDDSFGERLGIARWGQGAEVAICDWVLSEQELNAAVKSGLRVLAPGEPPQSE